MINYDLYVGVDWSGALGSSHRGISVFIIDNNSSFPKKINPPFFKNWSRTDLIKWLLEISKHYKTLIGIDFAFAYPFHKNKYYFNCSRNSPKNPFKLWKLIDKLNINSSDFYGGKIWDHDDFGRYYNAPKRKVGSLFKSSRRLTEINIKKIKSPSSAFNCVGPGAVGTGSLAGMRCLHYLENKANIWPFNNYNIQKNITIVETFPSLYFVQAGVKPIKKEHIKKNKLNMVLEYFDAKHLPKNFEIRGPDADDADALVSSLALKKYSKNVKYFEVPKLANYEGWIFGSKETNLNKKG